MIVPGSANALLLASLAGYQIPYSLRFRASNSAYLTRTPSAADATRTKASISIWLKRGALGGRSSIYAINSAGSAGASNQITMIFDNAGSNGDNLTYNNGSVNRTSTSVYRDPSAWYNLCQIFDTTQATAADRVKTYINGVLLTDINIGQDFTLNSNTPFGQSGVTEYIGRRDSGLYYDGYMAEIVFVVGQALTPSSFGQTDATTGVWVPKKYAGSYGTNGFYLKFADASAATAAAIGKDSSGNGNNWTPSGISVTSGTTFDQMLDTPTLNYAVMNPLDLSGTAATFQWANMQVTRSGASFAQAYCSIQMSSGKWYCEMTAGADVANLSSGIITGTANAAANRYLGQDSFTYGYDPDGRKVNNASYSLYGNSWTAGDIIGIILDADNGKLYFSKNGTVQNSGDPVAGTNAAFTGLTGPYRFAAAFENGGICDFNFGQRAFAYAPPTSFKALNTQNITSTAVSTSGSFTGNASTDGPFVWINGNPATLTINGNAVTFGTHADKTAGGFKLRSSSASYNASGSNSWTATAGQRFVQSKKPNNSQVNP